VKLTGFMQPKKRWTGTSIYNLIDGRVHDFWVHVSTHFQMICKELDNFFSCRHLFTFSGRLRTLPLFTFFIQ